MHVRLWKMGDHPAAMASLHREHHILESHWESICEATRDPVDPHAFSPRLEAMSALLMSHFWNEEKLMQEVGFPGYEDHVAEHRRIADACEGLLASVPASSSKWSQAIGFLHEWTVDHDLTHDRVFGKFLTQAVAPSGIAI